MKIETTRFGKLDVSEDDILIFPEGLLGFADHKRYVLLDSEELAPLGWLQCVDAGHLAFVVLDPSVAVKDYDVHVSRECAIGLDLQSKAEVSLLAIVTADPNPARCTINLQAPIIMNTRRGLARQIILLDQKYSIRHPLLSQTSEPASADQKHTVMAS